MEQLCVTWGRSLVTRRVLAGHHEEAPHGMTSEDGELSAPGH